MKGKPRPVLDFRLGGTEAYAGTAHPACSQIDDCHWQTVI